MASRPGGPPGQTSLRLEPRQILEVRPPLRDPALVARLVLGAHQYVRAALALGAAVDVLPALTDRFLDVAAIGLARVEAPDLLAFFSVKRRWLTQSPTSSWVTSPGLGTPRASAKARRDRQALHREVRLRRKVRVALLPRAQALVPAARLCASSGHWRLWRRDVVSRLPLQSLVETGNHGAQQPIGALAQFVLVELRVEAAEAQQRAKRGQNRGDIAARQQRPELGPGRTELGAEFVELVIRHSGLPPRLVIMKQGAQPAVGHPVEQLRRKKLKRLPFGRPCMAASFERRRAKSASIATSSVCSRVFARRSSGVFRLRTSSFLPPLRNVPSTPTGMHLRT